MLKESVVTNTWKCDACAGEVVSCLSPFFKLEITMPSMPNSAPGEIDLCRTCISTITVPAVVDYVAAVPEAIP